MQCMVLFQDSNGYIWIGTKGGVSRYDGVDFVNYSVNEGLPDGRIVDINEDENGNIWILTNSGLSVFNGRSFTFYPPKMKMYFKRRHLVFDNNGNIWVIGGVFKSKLVRFSNGSYEAIDFPLRNKYEKISGLIYDKKNDCLILSTRDRSNSFLYSYQNNKFKREQIKNSWLYLFPENNLIVEHKFKNDKNPQPLIILSKFDNGRRKEIFRSSDVIENPKQLNDSSYIFTSYSYIPNNPLNYIVNGKLQPNPVRIDQLNDILQDNESNIWLAAEKGLYRIVPFKNFTKKDNMPDYVWAIQEDRAGRIWFTSYSDDHLYFKEGTEIKKYPEKFSTGYFFIGATRLKNGDILFPYLYGIMGYNNKSFYKMKLPEVAATFWIYEDTVDSKLYIGNHEGLIIKDNNRYKVNRRFTKEKDDIILSTVRNKKGELWFITRKAFGILNRSDTLIMHNDTIKGAMCMICDYNNNLWIGTNNGLFLYNYKGFTKIYHHELKTMIGSIRQIDSTRFVYGGLRGIGIFNLEKFYLKHNNLTGIKNINAEEFINYYTQSHGFLGEEVGQAGIFKSSKGQIWIPTNNNVVMFDPKDLKRNSCPPKTHITQFLTSTDNTDWEVESGKTTKFEYNKSNIRIEFIGISLTAPDMVKYKYRLKGFNNNWSNETKERYVTYTNLTPGEYTFELFACNNNNIWTSIPVTKSFEIVPAWWQTLWFKVISIIMQMLFAGLIIMYFYHRRIKKRHLDDKLHNLQLKSMQSQLYPHLLFNMTSAAGAVIFKEDKEKAYDFVVKISKFMRLALEDTKRLYKSLQDELSFVETYLQLQKIRFPERFNYEINVDDDVDLSTQIPQMTIQTYVENAVKHGLEPLKLGGELQIKISNNRSTLTIRIEDNGVGIKEARKHKEKGTGNGMKIMNEIFEIHNNKNENKISYELIDLYKQGKKGTISQIKINI